MKRSVICASLCAAILLCIHTPALAQGESAVPFLLIAPSPGANGWGGVSTAVASDDPIATFVNPGQLGLFSLDNYFAASTYAPKTRWLPAFGNPDLTYNVTAANAGVNLARVFDLKLPISIGLGYSRVFLNLGTFITTSPSSPGASTRHESWERSECFSLGVGVDYFVRLGVGVNFEKIVSNLSPIGTEQEMGTGRAEPSATDVGVLLEAPIIDIVAKVKGEPVTLGSGLSPLVNLSIGYAHQNQGRSVSYVTAAMSDPLPRNAVLGISAELGLVMDVDNRPWKVIAFTLAREAEDRLIVRNGNGTFEYQSGLGDISFFKHVIRGKLDDNERPELHKGWQLEIGEAIAIRGGSFRESPNFGARNYSTGGYGIRLAGFLRLLSAIDAGIQSDGMVSFLATHIDLAYDHAEYVTTGPLGSTTFNGVRIVIR
ncbi:MAG: hypothetical protein IPI01_00410 [Ignavibacteriae bacterium]|nr:hypothetical protein [Ignavibacteriota bacterium]